MDWMETHRSLEITTDKVVGIVNCRNYQLQKFGGLESVRRGLFFVVHVPNVYITSFFLSSTFIYITRIVGI